MIKILVASLLLTMGCLSAQTPQTKVKTFPGMVSGYVDRVEDITVKNPDGSTRSQKRYVVACTNERAERCWFVQVIKRPTVAKWATKYWYAFGREQFPIGNPDMNLVADFDTNPLAFLPLMEGVSDHSPVLARTTGILMPFVTNQSGFDTAIAIDMSPLRLLPYLEKLRVDPEKKRRD